MTGNQCGIRAGMSGNTLTLRPPAGVAACRGSLLLQILVVRPAWIIAQRVHLRAASADRVQQIRQRHDRTVFLDQRSLMVLAGSAALRARQSHHGGGVLGKADRSVGHEAMLLAGAGGVTRLCCWITKASCPGHATFRRRSQLLSAPWGAVRSLWHIKQDGAACRQGGAPGFRTN